MRRILLPLAVIILALGAFQAFTNFQENTAIHPTALNAKSAAEIRRSLIVSEVAAAEEARCEIPADLTSLPDEAQKVFAQVMTELPCTLLQSIRTVEVFSDPTKPRALSGAFTMKLRADIFPMAEFSAVLLHEFGHVIDLGGLTGTLPAGTSEFWDGTTPIFENDPSLNFYRISWTDATKRKKGGRSEDFVSGYAMSDPFEDFAETLVFYRRHGNAFREMMKGNESLEAKYRFFRDQVFSGEEFTGDTQNVVFTPRPWDATRVASSK